MKTLRFRHEKLKELREQMGVSQQELANAISARYKNEGVTVSQGFISKMEVGDKGPGLETLAVLVDFFGVGYDYFLEGLGENEEDPRRVVMYGRNVHEARTIRTLVARMDQLSNEERNEIHAIAADCISLPAAECRTIHTLISHTTHLTPQERGMVTMLTKRLAETQPLNTKTVEADQAADLINSLPEPERVKALDAVRSISNLTHEAADLRASVSNLLRVVDGVVDPVVRDRIRTQIADSFGIDIDTIK